MGRISRILWPWATVWLGAFSAYAAFAPSHFINGDAAVYAELAQNGTFTRITTHLAYYVIAYPFTQLPWPLAHSLNLLNCAFGAGTVVLVGMLAKALFKSAKLGMFASLITVPNVLLVHNSVHAEVYAAQTFFLLFSIYLWITRNAIPAGMAAAIAYLISASSILAAPFFVLMRPRLVPIARLIAAGSVIVLPSLLPVLDDYLYSDRGLLRAAETGIDYKLALLKTGRDIFFGFFALLPLAIAGAFECYRRFRRLAVATILTWLSVFLLGERFTDVPVQLPTYMLFSVVAALGLLAIKRQAVILALLAAPIAAAGTFVAPTRFSHYLPTVVEITLYSTAVLAFAIAPSRAIIFAIAVNFFVAAKDASTARRIDITELNTSVIHAFSGAPSTLPASYVANAVDAAA